MGGGLHPLSIKGGGCKIAVAVVMWGGETD